PRPPSWGRGRKKLIIVDFLRVHRAQKNSTCGECKAAKTWDRYGRVDGGDEPDKVHWLKIIYRWADEELDSLPGLPHFQRPKMGEGNLKVISWM
ncbi:MAG: hypothetical protein WCP19_01605, partial [Chloroflexota bacterium]